MLKIKLSILALIIFSAIMDADTFTDMNLRIDSLRSYADSITNSTPFLIDKARNYEQRNVLEASRIYNAIIKDNKSAFWTSIAKDRLQRIQKNNVRSLQQILMLSDTLILKQTSDKCGEWGGDEDIVKIYFLFDTRQRDYEKVMAVHIHKEFMCDSLEKYQSLAIPKRLTVRSQKLRTSDLQMIDDCIYEILRDKLNNSIIISHSGIANSVEIKSSANYIEASNLIIRDYPATEWNSFKALIEKINK
jgi:hypothetical protein